MSNQQAEELWTRTMGALSELISEIGVMNNFGGSFGVELSGEVLTVQLVDSPMDGESLLRHFGACIQTALEQAGAGEVKRVRFLERVPEAVVQPVAAPVAEVPSATLIPSLTFNQFVEGPSNQFALAMAKYVAQHPGDEASHTNPLFMYGPTGVGKTHLLHAIGNMAREVNPQLRVLYTTSENLMNEYMAQWSRGDQAKENFRAKYRQEPHILLVDDIQYMAEKKGLQDEFFNIFNALRDNGRQIVITSDRPPSEIQNIMDRLISRLQSGICADVDIPAYETRFNILRLKLQSYPRVTLSREVMEFIAQRVTSSVRALEGALATTVRYAQTVAPGREDMVSVAALEQSVLKQFLQSEASIVQLTGMGIVEAVCRHYAVVPEKIFGEGREREVAVPRQIAMFLCRKLTSDSLPEIGRLFHRKHSTVSHACGTIQTLYKNGDAQTVSALRAILGDLERPMSSLS